VILVAYPFSQLAESNELPTRAFEDGVQAVEMLDSPTQTNFFPTIPNLKYVFLTE